MCPIDYRISSWIHVCLCTGVCVSQFWEGLTLISSMCPLKCMLPRNKPRFFITLCNFLRHASVAHRPASRLIPCLILSGSTLINHAHLYNI